MWVNYGEIIFFITTQFLQNFIVKHFHVNENSMSWWQREYDTCDVVTTCFCFVCAEPSGNREEARIKRTGCWWRKSVGLEFRQVWRHSSEPRSSQRRRNFPRVRSRDYSSTMDAALTRGPRGTEPLWWSKQWLRLAKRVRRIFLLDFYEVIIDCHVYDYAMYDVHIVLARLERNCGECISSLELYLYSFVLMWDWYLLLFCSI